MSSNARRQEALDYLGERTGTIEYRFIRYAAVADELYARGFGDSSILVDLGAGTCEFDFYLRTVRGWKGRYLPVDAAIDGTDFENGWKPMVDFEYVVAIELLEHLTCPLVFVSDVLAACSGVFVATTPNTDVLGADYVRKIDRTHISPLRASDLEAVGATVTERSFFGKDRDSLLGVWDGR